MYDLTNNEGITIYKCPFGEDANHTRRYCVTDCRLYDANTRHCSLTSIAIELTKTQELLTKNIKRGRWEKLPTTTGVPGLRGHYTCSICGWYNKGLLINRHAETDYNFCPNCGAKMTEDSVNGD